MAEINRVSVKIAGPAGEGVLSAGEVFAKCCSRGGLYVVTENERPSLIRGGHNQFMIRAEAKPINSHINLVNVLIALDKQTATLHANELSYKGAIIYDTGKFSLTHEELGRHDILLLGIPASDWVKELGVGHTIDNAIGIGACTGLLNYDLDILLKLLEEMYGKHPEYLEADKKAAKLAYDYTRNLCPDFSNKLAPIKNAPKRMLINGITASSLAAVQAGVSFMSAYPMTPSTGVIQTLAGLAEKYRIGIVQTEDEVASLNMALGASFAGVRAITASSGGGYALMNEGLSLAGITEISIVIVEVQRGGPGTGLPTRTEQSDLQFVLNSGHGEFPHIVIAPSGPESCYTETQRAFNLADVYQCPVTILLDRHNAETFHTIEHLPKDLPINRGNPWTQKDVDAAGPQTVQRYAFNSETGVSRKVPPGLKGVGFVTSGNEHLECGTITEDRAIRTRMVEKRARKLDTARKELAAPILDGDANADVTFVSWGSTLPIITDARGFLAEQGITSSHLHLTYMSPFHTSEVKEILSRVKNPVVVENNQSGQLAQLIAQHTGHVIKKKILQYDGWPFAPETIASRISEERWN